MSTGPGKETKTAHEGGPASRETPATAAPGPLPDPREREQIEDWAASARMRFENRYERLPQWETGRPQPALAELDQRGWIGQRVLDAGCGTGETAMHFAATGRTVWGVDIAQSAIGIARWRARDRQLGTARFMVGDVLRLEDYRLDVDTVIDAGCLHAMTDGEREAYVRSVGRVLRVGGMFHVLCFCEHDSQKNGPRRVRREELEGAFSGPGWEIEELVEARFETNIHKEGARAYRVSVLRRGALAEGEAE